MASGYEKAACGVDPRKDRRRPSRRENAILITFGVLGGVFMVITYIHVLYTVISWFA